MLLNSFASLTALLIATFSVDVVNGVNVDAFADTLHCSDNNFFSCNNIPAGTCCGPFPAAFGFSVRFFGLPNGSQGQFFAGSGCTSLIASEPGPNPCWTGAGVRALSASWAATGATKREASNEAECAQPDLFTYTDANGEVVRVRVPDGKAGDIADLFQRRAFKELALLKRADM